VRDENHACYLCVSHTTVHECALVCTASILYDIAPTHSFARRYQNNDCTNKITHHETYNGLLRARTLACRLGVMLRFLLTRSQKQKRSRVSLCSYELLFATDNQPDHVPSPFCRHRQQSSSLHIAGHRCQQCHSTSAHRPHPHSHRVSAVVHRTRAVLRHQRGFFRSLLSLFLEAMQKVIAHKTKTSTLAKSSASGAHAAHRPGPLAISLNRTHVSTFPPRHPVSSQPHSLLCPSTGPKGRGPCGRAS
jgi:hypothetical protein